MPQPGDGIAAASGCPVLKRQRKPTVGWDIATGGWIAGLLLVIPWIVADYGVTWDEPFHDAYARGAWSRIGSWWTDPDVLVRWNFWVYGGWFDALAIGIGGVLPFDPDTVRHAVNALVGIAGIAGTAALGRELAGPACGFLSALFLTLTPFWFGHMFNNSKDIPFGAAYVWAAWAATRADLHPERRGTRWKDVVRIGTTWGVALGARIAGGILFPAVAWALRTRLHGLGMACVVAYAAMLIGWPYAMAHPLSGPLHAAREIGRFTDAAHALVRFNGAWYRADEIPRAYAPGYLGVTLPEPVLIGCLMLPGLVFILRDRGRFSVTVLAVAFPLAVIMAGRTILYDGARHLLFLMPPLCALGAVGWLETHARLRRPLRTAVVGALCLWGLFQVGTMVILHPHEAVGYNRFTGGLAGAAGRWTLDVWGNSYCEAIRTFETRIVADGIKLPVALSVCPPQLSADRALPGWIVRVADPQRAGFHLMLAERPCGTSGGTPYVVIQRFGVPLAVIEKLR